MGECLGLAVLTVTDGREKDGRTDRYPAAAVFAQ